MDLHTFFRMAYPLNYQPVLKEMNRTLGAGQCLLFHESETINTFVERFETPRDVVDFMKENSIENRFRTMTIEDKLYVAIDEIIYIFFED